MRLSLLFSFVVFLVSFLEYFLDSYSGLAAASSWLKPLKFSISLCLYSGSLLYCKSLLTEEGLVSKLSFSAAATGIVVELSALVLQALMHSNGMKQTFGPACDQLFACITRSAILPVALADITVLYLLLRQKNLNRVCRAAVCWGAVLTAVGFIPGFLMLAPVELQHCLSDSAKIATGDFRAAHFVGLHSLQVLPIAGFFLEKFFTENEQDKALQIIRASGFSYFSLIIILTWQAFRGEAPIAPSQITMLTFVAWLAISALYIWNLIQGFSQGTQETCQGRSASAPAFSESAQFIESKQFRDIESQSKPAETCRVTVC